MSKPGVGKQVIKTIALRAWHEPNEANIFGAAAQLGFYFLLALFPMLIFLTSLIGFIPDVQRDIVVVLVRIVPREARQLVGEMMRDIVSNTGAGLFLIGLLSALWIGSSGTAALIDTLNTAYEVKESRPFWKVQLIALALTIALIFLIIGGALLIMFGDKLSLWLTGSLGLGPPWPTVWAVIDYVMGFALLIAGAGMIYRYGPNRQPGRRWIMPGAVFSALVSFIVSLLFSIYLRVAPSYSATYGGLGAVIVLMLWLYLMGLVVLVGGEINHEVEKLTGNPEEKEERI